jgi:molybdopterin biosynthesis enzyme
MTLKLEQSVEGPRGWTQFVEGKFQDRDGEILFRPKKTASRLQSMGDADGILEISEGMAGFQMEMPVRVQILPWAPLP